MITIGIGMNHIVDTAAPSAIKKYALVSQYLSHLNCLRSTLVPVQHIKKNPIREFTPARAATKHAGAKIGKSIEAVDVNAKILNMILKSVRIAFVTAVCNVCINIINRK
jgi:hypothetical protein